MTNYLWNHKLVIISSIIIVVNTYIYTYIYNNSNNNNKMCFSSSNLRLVTYNVHRFDMHGQNTVQKIKSHLSSLRPVPHIIALNEVNVVEKPKALDMIAEELNMKYVDATCPLVSKVHREAENMHKNGYHIILIGHKGHPEVIGTMGQIPVDGITLVETIEDVEKIVFKKDEK